MGVYIEGLDMPTSCGECHDSGLWSVISYLCKGGCFDDYSGCCAIGQAGFPLVEVKEPHGDLVDRDELIMKAHIAYFCDESGLEYKCMGVLEITLVDAPTVIEAEGNDD